MRLEKTRKFIIQELQKKSFNSCYYHGVDHSLEVEEACVAISEKEDGISDYETELLRIAALSHDIGHSEKRNGHEILGCNFIMRFLPGFGYSPEEISLVKGLILATKFPHNPKTLLENIICDADLAYIGLGVYDEQADKLRKELVDVFGYKFDDEEIWINYQIEFLEQHNYFTKYAQDRYDPIKNIVIKNLTEKLTLL
jgi:predicted metal-dependent HD superfamily phosphohydrolase